MLNKKRPSSKRKQPEKIVVSLGDPEAAVGRDKLKVFRPLYNTQLIYDLDCPLITAYDVFPWQNDAGTMKPMLRWPADQFVEIRQAVGIDPEAACDRPEHGDCPQRRNFPVFEIDGSRHLARPDESKWENWQHIS